MKAKDRKAMASAARARRALRTVAIDTRVRERLPEDRAAQLLRLADALGRDAAAPHTPAELAAAAAVLSTKPEPSVSACAVYEMTEAESDALDAIDGPPTAAQIEAAKSMLVLCVVQEGQMPVLTDALYTAMLERRRQLGRPLETEDVQELVQRSGDRNE